MAIDPATQAVDPAVQARRAAAWAETNRLRAEFRHDVGLAYGAHQKQVLDIYYPRDVAEGAPLLVFLHGGGFRRGEPGHVGYHGRPYVEHGALFVAMGYRLIPDARFPVTCEDVELGLRWLRERHAGRIYLSGHSAGAMLAACIGLRAGPLPADFISGLVLISGFYYVSEHSEEVIDRSSPRYVADLTQAIEQTPEHTILVHGDDDLPGVDANARAMFEAIRARGASVELFIEPNADHFQSHRGFISTDGAVFHSTRRMMRL